MSQRKTVKAYQLVVVGIILMLVGTYAIGGAAGGVLVFAGLFFWLMAIVVGIKKLLNRNGIKHTTQTTAEVMLTSFLAVKDKYKYPLETPADKIKIYTHVLSLRPGYTPAEIKKVLTEAAKLSQLKNESAGITLHTLVATIVTYEYVMDGKKDLTINQMKTIDSTLQRMFS